MEFEGSFVSMFHLVQFFILNESTKTNKYVSNPGISLRNGVENGNHTSKKYKMVVSTST